MKTLIVMVQYFTLMGALACFQYGFLWIGIILIGVTVGCGVYQVWTTLKEDEREKKHTESTDMETDR